MSDRRITPPYPERMMNMKRTLKILLCAALTAAICIPVLADVPATSSGLVATSAILSATEHSGEADVTADLLDGNTATAWVRTSAAAPDLSLALSGASVGEIWIRSGYCYNQNYYNSYDRPATVAVTIWYAYGQQSVTYRYTLSDAFLPTTSSADWSNAYQRLLLPEEYTGVTQIDLTIETVYAGRGNAGVAISDIALAADVHATATPRAYTTATPKPYIAYVTPRPSTTPTSTVEWITPTPTGATAAPTVTKDVDPTPTPTAEPVFPSKGVAAALTKRAATRSGPSNRFDEPGSFYNAGDIVNVISKAWDSENDIWWYQIEFNTSNGWMRAYTPANRVDVSSDSIPTETNLNDTRTVITSGAVYFGPSTTYRKYGWSWIYEGDTAIICQIEGSWAQVEYYSYAKDVTRRGWVKLDTLSSK